MATGADPATDNRDRCLLGVLAFGFVRPNLVASPVSCFRPHSALGRHYMPCQMDPARRSLRRALALRQVRAILRRHRNPRPGEGTSEGSASVPGPIFCSRSVLGLFVIQTLLAGWSARLKRNTVPSAHIRCSTTPSLRATATTARFIPRRCATRMPQACNQEFFELW